MTLRLRTVTDMYAGRAHLYLGDYPRAIEIFGGIVDALTGSAGARPPGRARPAVRLRAEPSGRSPWPRWGASTRARRYADEAIALAETTNHPDTDALGLSRRGGPLISRAGRSRRATEAFERAYSVCREHDMPTYRPRLSAELGARLGPRRARRRGRPHGAGGGGERPRARRQTASYSHVLLLQAEVYLLADRVAEASRGGTRRALALFRRQGERGHEARALWLPGEIAARGEPSMRLTSAKTAYAEASEPVRRAWHAPAPRALRRWAWPRLLGPDGPAGPRPGRLSRPRARGCASSE